MLAAKTVVALGTYELIQAAVLLHPSYVTLDEVKGKSFSNVCYCSKKCLLSYL